MAVPVVEKSEELISIATAALLTAQADAKCNKQIIFRKEWEPTPRFRDSASNTLPAEGEEYKPRSGWKIIVETAVTAARVISGFESTQPQKNQPSTSSTPLHDLAPSTPAPAPVAAPTLAPAPSPVPTPAPAPATAAVVVPAQAQQLLPVEQLLDYNKDVYNQLIEHPFPKSLGGGTASLDGFRYYLIQDTYYLQLCARVKMGAFAYAPDFKKHIENFSKRHESSLEYIKTTKMFLSTMLGISEEKISETEEDKCLLASREFYKENTQDNDAWLAYYVVLLPCVLAYWKIAERLMESPSTVRNTVYFPTWIENNYDSSSAEKYIKFLNENIRVQAAKVGANIDRWNTIFGKACQLEAAIFDTGRQAPAPYLIVDNGIYSIQSAHTEGDIVLSHQSVKNSPNLSIVGVNKTGRKGENEKWNVVVTKDGYTFKNVETGRYLGYTIQKQSGIVQLTVEPYYWWINPVEKRPSWYQIYVSGNLRYALQAGEKVPTSSSFSIIASDNFKGSYQMWSFQPEQLERPLGDASPSPTRECSGFPTGRFRIRAAGTLRSAATDYYWTCESWNSKKEGNLICIWTLSPGHIAQIFYVNSEGHLCIDTGLQLDVSGNALILAGDRQHTEFEPPNPWAHPLPTFLYAEESKTISVKLYSDPLVSDLWPRPDSEWKDKEFVVAARSVTPTKGLDFQSISRWAPSTLSSSRKFKNTNKGFQAHALYNLGVEEKATSMEDPSRLAWELESVTDPV